MAESREGMMSGEDDPIVTSMRSAEETISELIAEGASADSRLGRAVDNLYVSWNQLLTNLTTKTLFQAPGPEHIKEVAEFTLKQLKDASQDVSREFAQAGLEWRITHPEEARAEDLKNYDSSIERQQKLIQHATEVVEQRLQESDTAQPADEPMTIT